MVFGGSIRAGVSFELGGRWREELPQYLNSADTQQYTASMHPVRYPPGGNMGRAFADSSFLDWLGFLRRRVLKLGSLLQHQGAVRCHCRKLNNTTTTTSAVQSGVRHHRNLESLSTAICRDTVSEILIEYSSCSSSDDMHKY